jgi:hypothetical protein
MHVTLSRRPTRSRTTRIAGWTLAVLLVGAPIAAQQADQPAVEFQSFRLPGWSFTPSIAFGTIYDTNVALTSPRASIGDTQGDSLFNVVPGGQLEFIGKHTEFSANYRGFLRRYFEVRGLDGFNQRASVGFKHAMSKRLSFFARDSFTDTPTTDEVEVNGVPFRRTGSRTNLLAAGTEYRLTKFTTWSARYDRTWVEFDRPDIFLTGGWIQALRSELSHQVSERVSLGGEYSYRTASLDEGQRELGFQDAGGVIRFAFGPHTSGSAAAGLGALTDRNTSDTRTGPYVRLGVTHVLEYATVGAGFERQYVPSFGFGGASSSQELHGYILMPLGRQRLYTQASGRWRRTRPFENDVLQLDTISLHSTLGYAATRWARVEALYTYTRQDSIVTGGEVDRHRIGVQFVISQPMRIR